MQYHQRRAIAHLPAVTGSAQDMVLLQEIAGMLAFLPLCNNIAAVSAGVIGLHWLKASLSVGFWALYSI